MWVGLLLSVHKLHRTICQILKFIFVAWPDVSLLTYCMPLAVKHFFSLNGLYNTKVWKLFISKINGRKTDQRTWTKHDRPRDQLTQVLFKLFNEKSSPVDNLFKSPTTTGLECSVWYWMPGLCPNRWIHGICIWYIRSGQCIRLLIQFSYLPKINQTNGLDRV